MFYRLTYYVLPYFFSQILQYLALSPVYFPTEGEMEEGEDEEEDERSWKR